MEELYSIYYNPKSGLLSPYKLYLKLKKNYQRIQDIPERKFLMNPNSGFVLTNHFKFPNDIQVGDYVRILKEKKQFQKGYAE